MTTANDDDRRRAVRFAGVTVGASLLAYAVASVTVWLERFWHPLWDSAVYVLTAQSLARGEGYTFLDRPFLLRPPGMSWLLSHFMPDGAFDPAIINVVVMMLATAAVFATYAMIRTRLEIWSALLVALLTGTSPIFVRYFNYVLAEYPSTALLFAAIALLHVSLTRSGRWWPWSLAGAACAVASVYVRTAGAVVVPALVIVGFATGRWRRVVLPVIVIVAAMVPWWSFERGAAEAWPSPSDQLLLYDYSTAMWHTDPGDPASPRVTVSGWIDRIASNGAELAADLTRTTIHTRAAWASALLLLLLATTLVLSLRRRVALHEVFAILYLGVLLTYFTYTFRLAIPLVPFLYLGLLGAIGWIGERAGRPRTIPIAAGVLLLAVNLATLSNHAVRIDPADVEGPDRRGVYRIADWLVENTAEDATVLCRNAAVLGVLSGRRTYTYEFVGKPHRPPPLELIARYDPGYVVIANPEVTARLAPTLRRDVEARALESWTLPSNTAGQPIRIYRLAD